MALHRPFDHALGGQHLGLPDAVVASTSTMIA
jgi:hypothetical protein